jgi:two-component system response regulator AlgR
MSPSDAVRQSAKALLIVDDEVPARDRLERIVAEIPGWDSIGSCGSGTDAIRRVERERPAVVLLDIQMPGMSGIEVARHLTRLERPPAVIFTTAYDEYALEAFDAHAVDYLLKPVRRQRLEAALAQATRPTAALLGEIERDAGSLAPRRHIAVRDRGELRLVPIAEISYFQAEQKYVSVHHGSGSDLIDESLKQLETEFADRFVRVHRSLLVAVEAIAALERDLDGAYWIRLRGQTRNLPVSRREVTGLKARLAAGR